jgi:4-amino-4-deoxy-L-arabinose transferase-like glycosyltransferase
VGASITERSVARRWSVGRLSLFLPPVVAALLLGTTLRHREYNEPFFVGSTYYVLFALLLVYAGVRLSALGETHSLRAWVKENLAGFMVTAMVSAAVFLAVTPAFRVLADEANLVGVSKNLFFRRTANFAVTGKWYFENFWSINEATDRRPALFPFLVSLLHTVRGYHYENAFHLNAIVFVLFVFSSYRLAKSLGGELFGIAAAILVAANPNTLVAVRSAGFDFLSAFLLLVVIQSAHDHLAQPSPRTLATLVLNLCLLAHVRYEGWALAGGAAAVLLLLRQVRRAHLRGFGFVYALVPLFLLPRWWQSVAKANDAEQPLSASLFSVSGFWRNAGDYLRILARPLDVDGPHSPWLLMLGAGGLLLLVFRAVPGLRARELSTRRGRLLALVSVLLGMNAIICFAYGAGKPLHPASSRLFIWLDTLFSFAAAYLLTVVGRRWAVHVAMLRRRSGAPLTILACAALFAVHVPVASEARFVNALTLTRQAAATWRFFERIGEKRILILTDRPGLFTIMDYGALDISLAGTDRSVLLELSRHLYQDIYLVQEIDLETDQPRPDFATWPDVPTETVFEFQNTDTEAVRIARVKR